MTRTLKDLQKLEPVLQAAFEAERQKMAALGEQINRLVLLREAMTGQVPTGDLALHLSGADLRWSTWSQARRKELSMQLARLMARREAARDGLSRAFGRLQAVQSLIEQEQQEQRRRATRA